MYISITTAYLWSSVGDALQDPVDGGGVEGQILGDLHPLQHQLVLDALAADLPEGAQQVEEVPVQAVLQLGGHLHAHLHTDRDTISVSDPLRADPRSNAR